MIQDIMSELRARGPSRHLLAVVDMATLNEDQRNRVQTRFGKRAHPLLRDSAWAALFPYSPLLLAAYEVTDYGHHHLYREFQGEMGELLQGLIISTVPAVQLAEHLAQATVAHGPEGDAYLLRYHDPAVLPVLYQYADPHWWAAFMGPIVSWRVPRADTEMRRWGRIPGRGVAGARAPSPLLIHEALWQALISDPLPHRLLQAAQSHTPPLFDISCPGVRLARVEAHLARARQAGLSAHEDLHDYVFMALSQGSRRLEANPIWLQAVHAAASGAGRLGDLYLAMRQRPA